MFKNYFSSLTKKAFVVCLSLAGIFSGSTVFAQSVPALHYTFASATIENDSIIKDQSVNGYDGILRNEAIPVYDAELDMNVLDLGTFNGYLDMQAAAGGLVSELTDFTIATYFRAGDGTDLGQNGNMLWAFANSDDMGADANGNMFWHIRGSNRYAISATHWQSEKGASTGISTVKNEWHHVAVTQLNGLVTVYYDGIAQGTSSVDLTPSSLGATSFNFIGKPCYTGDIYCLDTKVADFRVYKSAVDAAEMLTLASAVLPEDYPLNILAVKEALDLGDLSNVTSAITLPLVSDLDPEFVITWASTNKAIIDTLGNITQPEDLDVTVGLTATMTKNGYSITKQFLAVVPATGGFDEPLIANWLFEAEWVDGEVVTDAAEKHYVGTMMNGAKVRKIGTPETFEFYTLDLGTEDGYFDMGTDIGKLIYGLGDFTISTYLLVDTTYESFTSNGNFLWNFSNSEDLPTEQNGNMSFNLPNTTRYFIGPKYYGSGQQNLGTGTPITKGFWHQIAYTQSGQTGTVYVDGEIALTGTITNLPSTTLVIDGRAGTLYNWIGRACYPSDVYLGKTLIYDFRMYNFGVSADDIYYSVFNEGITLDELNQAYEANPDPSFPPELFTAREALDLGDISAITSDIVLPELLDNDIVVEWTSSNDLIIDVFGTVVRPDNLNGTVVLTAALSKNGYKVYKDFTATVLATGGFSSSLILNYNFADEWITGDVVKDAADLHHEGSLEHGAIVETIGEAGNEFNVLNLYADSAYFDMGEEAGKLPYGLSNYSTSIYFYIDSSYTESDLGANGNFLYTFSNGDSSEIQANGYMMARATSQAHTIAVKRWDDGNVSTPSSSTQPKRGQWFNFVFTQDGTIGTVYINGDTLASIEFANIPSVALPKEGLEGTKFNFLGRPNFTGDAYLGKSKLYDFRLYSEALTPAEVDDLVLKVVDLNTAVGLSVPLQKVKVSDYYRVDTSIPGLIQIKGLKGHEKVTVYELTGRTISTKNSQTISARRGIYLVRVDNTVTKVLVK